MPLLLSFALGLAFAFIALVNASLAAWLWTFPMVPDPGGNDPNGRSTAPRFWTQVHRVLGVCFCLAYLALMSEMVPRLWQHQEGLESGVIIHALLGAAVGPLLAAKILIIRRFQKLGKRLPLLGGSIAVFSLTLIALVAGPASRIVLTPPITQSAAYWQGWKTVSTKCQQCHGSGTIFKESRSAEGWSEVFEEMLEESAESHPTDPLHPGDGRGVVEYLLAKQSRSEPAERTDRSGSEGDGRRGKDRRREDD